MLLHCEKVYVARKLTPGLQQRRGSGHNMRSLRALARKLILYYPVKKVHVARELTPGVHHKSKNLKLQRSVKRKLQRNVK